MMRRKIEWVWERLDTSTWRAKVIGGWALKSECSVGKQPATALTFIPDRDHEWSIAVPVVEMPKPKVDIAKDFKPMA